MSLDDRIRALIAEAVTDAAERASRSKECMSAKEAQDFLGLTDDEWKKRFGRIPRRQESQRKNYYLREDLLEYLRSLPRVPDSSGYALDYGRHLGAPHGSDEERFTA